jgi:hypothetical protein
VSVAGGWLLVPLVLVLLCTGIGLLLQTLTRTRIAGPFVPGVGLAGLIVLAGLCTIKDWSAELAPWLCLAAALAGYGLNRPRPEWGWPWVVGLAVFASLAAPSVLSGQASVAGYIKLDDSAIWLGLIAHLMEHGRDIAGVPPSTFQLDLVNWIGNAYPVGGFMPVGVTAKLTGQDYANTYQPVISTLGAIGALGLYGCVRELVQRPGLAAVAAIGGAHASLFAGYAQWGSVKEIAAVALIPALIGPGVAGRNARAVLLAAVPAGALLDTYGAGGIVWAGPALVIVAVLALIAVRVRALVASAGAAALVAVCALPAIVVLSRDIEATTHGSPADQADIGKLVAPLKVLQGAGLWPAGDFRYLPPHLDLVRAVAILGLVLCAGAVAVSLWRRRWTLPILIGVIVLAAAVGLQRGGPWIDAKVLAITSPFLLTAAIALLALAHDRRTVIAAVPIGGVMLAATVASAWLVARDVYIAPRDELVELRALGEQLAGKGPTLVLNYEGYATRYFLGPAQDEGVSELRHNLIPNRDGQPFPNYTTAELDDVDQAALFSYPLLVRRTTPTGSRVPSGYTKVHDGRFFEAWRQDGPLPTDHTPLGAGLEPGGPLPCPRVRGSAAGVTTLVAAPVVNPVVKDIPDGKPNTLDGAVTVSMRVPQAGSWRTWVGGGVLGHLKVSVDGKPVGDLRHQLDAAVGWLRLDALELSAGRHELTVDYRRGSWRPGRGNPGGQLPLGPVALSLEDQPPTVRVPASQATRLCDGRTYDWLETFK